MFDEFKKFIMRGNVIDLAVGVIMGTAFGAVVKSLVDDVIMPPIGMLTGGVNFADLFVSLNGQSYASLEAAQAAGAPVIAYGAFINAIITFLIVALAVFLLVKAVNQMYKPKAAEPAPPTDEAKLLAEIRDLLKTQRVR